MVACQGPIENTVIDFWRMVKQENIGYIFMLCKLKEDGRKKCEKYWPDADESIKFEEISLEIRGVSEKVETENLVHREFALVDTSNNETISQVQQIQYLGWPDHGIPEKHQFEDFDKLFEHTLAAYNSIKAEESTKKIGLHCSAGIGRTGTLLSLLHAVANIQKQKEEGEKITKISVFSTVRKLREHRFHLVQSDSQYYFIYEYLSAYLKKIKLI